MRFLKLIHLLFAIFLLTILAAKLIGHSTPDPVLALFTNPDGSRCQMPCLLGIRPGETTVSDAITIIKEHPLTSILRIFRCNAAPYPPNSPFYEIRTYGSCPSDSVFFAGESDQIIEIEVQGFPLAKVTAARISSLIDPDAPDLPTAPPALVQAWHQVTFEHVVASVGPPQTLSFPDIGPNYVWSGTPYFETFYNDNRLVFTFSSTDGKPYFGNNAFGSVSVYTDATGDNLRFKTGYQNRVGAVLPWLGLARPQKYVSWLNKHEPASIQNTP